MTQPQDAAIERLALQGLDASIIARRLGRGLDQILSRARLLGIPITHAQTR